jgi:hypothetical protein
VAIQKKAYVRSIEFLLHLLIASHRIHFYDETKRMEPVRVSKNFGRSAKSEQSENTLLKPTARGASSPLYLKPNHGGQFAIGTYS